MNGKREPDSYEKILTSASPLHQEALEYARRLLVWIILESGSGHDVFVDARRKRIGLDDHVYHESRDILAQYEGERRETEQHVAENEDAATAAGYKDATLAHVLEFLVEAMGEGYEYFNLEAESENTRRNTRFYKKQARIIVLTMREIVNPSGMVDPVTGNIRAYPPTMTQAPTADRTIDSKEQRRRDIDHRFTYHPPQPGQPAVYTLIRDTARDLAHILVDQCPESRDLDLALEALETAVFRANAAIARG